MLRVDGQAMAQIVNALDDARWINSVLYCRLHSCAGTGSGHGTDKIMQQVVLHRFLSVIS